MKFALVFVSMVVFLSFAEFANGLSCQWAGHLGCQGSCMLKNCATGSCNPNDVCVCGRCANGSAITISAGKRDDGLARGDSCTYGGIIGCSASCASQGRLCGGTCVGPSKTCVCNACSGK